MLRGLFLFLAVLLGAASAHTCDHYNNNKLPCVAAYSTCRALLRAYGGGLYQVERMSDHKKLDIIPVQVGGLVNAALHDSFCEDGSCVISIIYDQSGKGNHLTVAPGGGANKNSDKPAVASRHRITIGNQKAYGVYIEKGIGYRNNKTNGMAKGDDAQAIYMVVNGKHYNDACCFDFGSAELNTLDDGPGTMEALYFGNNTFWGKGLPPGPWAMADLEDGLFGCADKFCPNLPVASYRFLVAMLKGRSGGTFALKQGNAHSGMLMTTYDGPRPDKYQVMKKQGAIVLGIGGDNSNWAVGTFYEGVIVNGNPANHIDDEIQANIVAAGYGR